MAELVEDIEQPQVQEPTDKTKILYDAVSKKYDVGSYDEFSKKLQDPTKRKSFYDGVGHEYELGTYDEFTNKVGAVKKKDGASTSLVTDTKLPSPNSNTDFTQQGQQLATGAGLRNIQSLQAPTEHIPQAVSAPSATNLPDVKEATDNAVQQRIKAKRGVYDATMPKPTKEEVAKETDFVNTQIKNGNLVPDKNNKGESVLKRGTGFLQSFNESLEGEHKQALENTYVANLPKDKAIEYLNNKRQHPDIMGSTEKETAPNGVLGQVGDLLGSNIGMIAKGIAGAIGGMVAAPETGGASFGTFLATVKEMAHGGYANALEKNYNGLKEQHPEMSDAEAYDKAHNAALVGEAVNIGTGAVLAHSLPTPKASIPPNSVLESLGHAIKTSPKVIGSSAAGSLLNDITSNISGNKVSGDEMSKNALEQAKNMAVMHFGLWGLTEPGRIPSYIRPQIENVVASAPREEVKDFYDKMEQTGAIPEGTTSKVLSKLDEFDKQKQVVNDMPLNEEQKASITGKLLQRKKIEEENSTLKNYGGSFNARVDANNQQLEGLDSEIDGIIKTGNVARFEKDNLTGEPLTQSKPHEELTKPEREGIVVPKDYGTAEVEENGEGENKTFKPKAYYTENSGGLSILRPIKIEEGKTYTDKDKAQKAADEALDKHYYENAMPEHEKPIAKESKGEPEKITKPIELSIDESTKNPIQTTEELKPTEVPNQRIGEAAEGTIPTESTVAKEPTAAGSGETNRVGVSHNSLTDLANKLGLGEPQEGEYWEPEHYAERGRRLLAAGAEPQDALNPNNELHDRISISRANLEDLTKIADAMGKKWGIESKQYKEAKNEVDDFSKNVVKKLGTLAHRGMTSLQGQRDLDTDSFTTVINKVSESTGEEPTKEQFKKAKVFTETNEKLKTEADSAEAKLVEETDNEFSKKQSDKPSDKKYAEKAKKAADTFRKLKVKEFKFTDENGNEVSIEKMGISWNDLVEVGAKVIEKTGELADGVKAIIDEIKDTNFYNNLSDKKKEDLQKQLEEHFQSAVEKTPEYKKIKTLEAELEKLKQGKIKGKPIKLEDSPRAKELKDAIFDEKNKLGLIPSKVKSIPETNYGMEETPEVKNVRRLEKELEELQQGIAKQNSPSRELTEQEKQLKEKIADEKERLGLVKSKGEKPLTESEQQDLSDKKKEDLQKQFVDKKDTKFTVDEAKNIWEYAKETYLDKGVKYRDMISLVADDLGLSWRQISEAITSPKTKRTSDAMWKKQSDYKRNQNATKRWVEEQSDNKYVKALKAISGKIRGLSVFGHGGIFIGTHAGMTFFQPSTWKHTIPAFFRAWKFAYGNEGNYHRAMEELKSRENYTVAQRAGLKNNPDILNAEEFQKSQRFLGKLGGAGEHGFNAIKVLRQDLFDSEYNKLSAADKADPAVAESIARIMNNATGATNLTIPEWVNEASFAGGMEAARWGKLTRNPVKATEVALRALRNPENVSAADKVFAKVWAKRVGQQLGTFTAAMIANAAIQNTINPKNKTNLTDPSQSDWMKFKFGDVTIDPTSGMLGVINFIKGLALISVKDQKELKGDTRMQAYGKKAMGYARGKAAPLYSKLADVAFQSDFNGNPLPWSNDKPQAGRHKLTPWEYAFQFAPLPIAEAANVAYKSANENGDKSMVDNIMNGIMLGAISGGTGFRVGETSEKPTPFTEADKSDPTFKFFYDKGLELPNTALSSEDVIDEAAGTKTKISELPHAVQEKYQEEHKKQLKEKLKNIIDNDIIYVTTLKKPTGEKENIISLNEKSNSKEVSIKDLSKEDLTQVLKLAQTLATKSAKKEIFNKE